MTGKHTNRVGWLQRLSRSLFLWFCLGLIVHAHVDSGGMRRDTCGSLPSWAACLVAVSACAGPATAPEDPSTYSDSQIESLAQALGGRRLFQPRLTGGFAWAPCEPPEEEPEDLIPSARCGQLPEPGTPERARLVDVWTQIVQADPGQEASVEHLHARGLGYLLWSTEGDERQLEQAVADLERAAELAPGGSAQRAAVLSDLAAAYRVRAGWRDRAQDLMETLGLLETAFELSPESAAIAFNRGLARSDWSLRSQAKTAWDDFLALESASDWSQEARSRREGLDAPTRVERWNELSPALERLAETAVLTGGALDPLEAETVAAVVAELPLFTREYAQNVALAAWADAHLQGEEISADRWLALSRAIGEALAAQGIDQLVADAVSVIDESRALPDRLALLAEGHSAYGQAYRRGRGKEEGDECESYRASEIPLGEAETPLKLWATLSLAMSCLQLTDLPAAERIYRDLETQLDPTRYPALAGRVAWMISIADARQGWLEDAYRHGFDALDWMDRAADPDVASVVSLLGDSARTLGLYDEAWSHHWLGLRSQAGLGDPRGLFVSLLPVAQDLLEDRRLGAAEPVIAEMEAAAELVSLPIFRVYAASHRARLEALKQEEEAARAALGRARQRVTEVSNPGTRRRIEADLDREEGRLAIASTPATAIEHLTSAMEAYEAVGDRGTVPEVYLLRASAHLESGQTENAERDFERALHEMELRRAAPRDERLRISFFETFQDALDRMLRFRAVDQEDPAGAFELAERARGRALLDWVGSTWPTELYDPEVLDTAYPKPIGLDELRATLPSDLTLIEYAVLPDELLIWVLRREGVWLRRETVAQEDLAQTVRRFRELLEHGATEKAVQGPSGRLFDHLVRPVEELLPPTDASIVVVPDRFLHRVPWAALWDSQTETWWVERHALAVSPSASVLAASLLRGRDPRGEPRGSALVLADPTVDAEAYPDLPALRGAASEGRAVAELYPGARLLTGPRATARAFLEEAPQHKVLHIAAHAQYLDEAPAFSSLLLAGTGDGDDGAFRAYDLYDLDLSGVELVVLAACRTVDGFPQAGREGVAGWARAFLAAGAAQVVAGLWPVEDEASEQFMVDFHRRLRRNVPPIRALQQAKLALLREGSPGRRAPARWGAFQLYGLQDKGGESP